MPKINTLTVTTLSLLAAGAAATASITPFAVPQRRLLPIDTLPQRIGSWKAISEHPVEQAVQDRLPTARIVDRVYEDARTGNQVDVMLLTATAVEDIHKPTSCLPAQGWQIDSPTYEEIDGQRLTVLSAANEANERIHVGYWLTGYYPPGLSHGHLVDSLLAARNRIVGTDKAMSLFVRVISNEVTNNTAMTDFVRDALPSIRRLTDAPETPAAL